MFRRAVHIARIRGIDVRLDPSLILIAVLVGWTFGTRFDNVHDSTTAWTMAVVGTVLFFGSILAHELAHALEALHRGLEVEGITLFLFGGVTEMHAHTETPRDEFVVAAVGPYVSLLCGAVFGLVATFVAPALGPLQAPVADVAGLLGWLNVLLAVFNLVPGAPLDGGRVLRALLWWLTRDRRRALRIAGRAGQALGLGLIGLGLWASAAAPAAGFIAGFWWIVIGFFLWSAARSELRQSDVDDALRGRTVADLVGALPEPVRVDQRLDTIDEHAAARGAELLPVAADGHLVGVLPLTELHDLHPTDRSVRTAGELMRTVDDRPSVDLDADVRLLIAGFAGDQDVVRLSRNGRAVAAVTEREVARALQALRTSGGGTGQRRPSQHVPQRDGSGVDT